MFKKRFLIVWLFIAIIIVGGFLIWQLWSEGEISLQTNQQIEQNEQKDEFADWKNYQNEEYDFEFKYPEKWILIEDNLRKDSLNDKLKQWGQMDDWCVGFNTGIDKIIDKEKVELVVYVFFHDAYTYKKLCEEKGGDYCRYNKEDPFFSNKEIKTYKPIALAYDWLIESLLEEDKFIGLSFGRNIPEGIGIPDYLGSELRKELDDLSIKILSTFRFLE